MKLTPDQVRMLAEELTIDETCDNDSWIEMVRQIKDAAAGRTRTLLHRHLFPGPDENLYEIPNGATHYAHRRLVDGPAIDFWRIEE